MNETRRPRSTPDTRLLGDLPPFPSRGARQSLWGFCALIAAIFMLIYESKIAEATLAFDRLAFSAILLAHLAGLMTFCFAIDCIIKLTYRKHVSPSSSDE